VVTAPLPARLAPFLHADAPLMQLAARFTAAGHSLSLVGGWVRDAVAGREVSGNDIDLATDARPDAIEAVLEGWAEHLWLQGKRFGTVGAMRSGLSFEITTFRAEVYLPESRKPEVVFGDDLETDLSRRDFTVNAMALALPELEFVDPYGGLADLAARRLRTPLSVEVSFLDDPLRMLRAARFASQLELEPDPEVVEAMALHRDRLEIVSAERIRDELSKLLVTPDPQAGLWLLARTRLADEFLPELNAMQLEQDPIHRHKDVLAHTIAVVANTRADLRVRLAALLHDIGKPKTRGYAPGGVTFHHHEVVGARMARERLVALRYPNDLIEDVVALVALHLRFHTYRMGWTDSAVRRYVRDAGPLLDDLNHLTRCDCTTRNQKKAAALSRRMDELEERIAELREKEELASIRPPLDGRQVMEFLGIEPSKPVGEALAFLLEERLEYGPIPEDEARGKLAVWARARGIEPKGAATP
jgi:poly(A) polymerase